MFTTCLLQDNAMTSSVLARILRPTVPSCTPQTTTTTTTTGGQQVAVVLRLFENCRRCATITTATYRVPFCNRLPVFLQTINLRNARDIPETQSSSYDNNEFAISAVFLEIQIAASRCTWITSWRKTRRIPKTQEENPPVCIWSPHTSVVGLSSAGANPTPTGSGPVSFFPLRLIKNWACISRRIAWFNIH